MSVQTSATEVTRRRYRRRAVGPPPSGSKYRSRLSSCSFSGYFTGARARAAHCCNRVAPWLDEGRHDDAPRAAPSQLPTISEKPSAKLLKVDRQCRRKPRPCRRANDANHHSDLHGCWRCPGSAVEFRATVMRRQRLPVLRGALAPSSLELPSRHRGKIDSGLLALESPPELTPGKLEFSKNHARNSAASRFPKRCCTFATGRIPPLACCLLLMGAGFGFESTRQFSGRLAQSRLAFVGP